MRPGQGPPLNRGRDTRAAVAVAVRPLRVGPAPTDPSSPSRVHLDGAFPDAPRPAKLFVPRTAHRGGPRCLRRSRRPVAARGERMRVLLVGPDHESNLSLLYLAASLRAAGHEPVIAAFNGWDDAPAVLRAARSADLVGLSMCFQLRARRARGRGARRRLPARRPGGPLAAAPDRRRPRSPAAAGSHGARAPAVWGPYGLPHGQPRMRLRLRLLLHYDAPQFCALVR